MSVFVFLMSHFIMFKFSFMYLYLIIVTILMLIPFLCNFQVRFYWLVFLLVNRHCFLLLCMSMNFHWILEILNIVVKCLEFAFFKECYIWSWQLTFNINWNKVRVTFTLEIIWPSDQGVTCCLLNVPNIQ